MSFGQNLHDPDQPLRALRRAGHALAVALALACASSGGKKGDGGPGPQDLDGPATIVDGPALGEASAHDDRTPEAAPRMDPAASDAAAAPGPPDAGRLGFAPGPGTATVMAVDRANMRGMNVSGLAYLPAGGGQPPALLAVQNGPSKIY